MPVLTEEALVVQVARSAECSTRKAVFDVTRAFVVVDDLELHLREVVDVNLRNADVPSRRGGELERTQDEPAACHRSSVGRAQSPLQAWIWRGKPPSCPLAPA
jgi:hypothetical protein